MLLGYVELAAAYDRALEGLVGKQGDWLELRKRANDDPNNFWEPFAASYDVLDLSWFDDAYFETYSPSLVARLVSYVKSHKDEFIAS